MTAFTHAIVRSPGADMAAGLTTANLGVPDYALALEQHARYVEELERAGLSVTALEPLPGFPDAHFVEDVAVVTPEVAVIARPGAEARRGEAEFIEAALAKHRSVARIQAPGTLDGGDVLSLGRQVFVGLSSRTNREGARQLEGILRPFGYCVAAIPVGAGLHFKSSVNLLTDDTLLVTSTFNRHEALTHFDAIVVDEGDEYSANVLRINDRILVPAGFPRTIAKLERLGESLVEVEVSEMQKMDGGLTCMSVRL
jgi:dimethylargininase